MSRPAPAVLDLILDPSNPAAHERPLLPHALGDGEAEALGQALLDDDIGPALQRVDDGRVFLQVVRRDALGVEGGELDFLQR